MPRDYNYLIAPWEQQTADGESFWAAPVGTVGLVDLRSVTCQSIAGEYGNRPYGFFAVDPSLPVGSEAVFLGRGDCRELHVTSVMRDAWESAMGYRPSGAMLVDLLFGQLTDGAVVSDDAPVRPLMPTMRNNLELRLGGHSIVRSERFRFGSHPHTNRVQDALREEFARHFSAADRGKLRPGQHQRVLDFWLAKYKIPKGEWNRLVPPKLRQHIPGPLPHETTITESFPTNGNTITTGQDLTWTNIDGALKVVSGICTSSGMGNDEARAEHDLSSDDHYAQCEWHDTYVRVMARYHSSAQTNYVYGKSEFGSTSLGKWVSGTFTQLSANVGDTPSSTGDSTIHLRCEGSSIAGSMINSGSYEVYSDWVTDTAITGNLRTGVGLPNSTGELDNFEAADLPVPAGGIAMFAAASQHAQWRGGL